MSPRPEPMSPRARHYAAIVLSPHLDDAVFSCAGLIADARAAGPVLVVNLFTRYLEELRSRAVVLTDARHAEEAAAARLLGFESICLDELDVSFRHPHYRSLGNIFRPPVPEDLVTLPRWRQLLAGVLEGVSCDTLAVPLGIGWHVDHMLVHQLVDPGAPDAAIGLRCARSVTYYEDLPYGLIPHATRLRLAELGLAAPRFAPQLAQPGLGASCWQVVRAYNRTAMMRNLRPWPLRQLAVPVVGVYLARLVAFHHRAAATAVAQPWEPAVRDISAGLPAKVAAMQCYASQFREFFLGPDDCADQLRAYTATYAPAGVAAAERTWTTASPRRPA